MSAPPPPFSRRVALGFLVGAVVLFVFGIVSLLAGWLEIATVCAGIFAVGWLGLRARLKRVKEAADRRSKV